jgi:two-component system OmpR family sensor kinase
MADPLQRRLSVTLAAAILLVGVVGAIASFVSSYHDARELQDDALRQVAGIAHAPPKREMESQMFAIRLPGDAAPRWLPLDLAQGFHTIDAGGETMRVFVRDEGGGQRTIIGQATELRDEAALASALRTVVPLLVLLPLLAWLTGRVLLTERRVLDERRRFIADAAHELRGPLTALSLQAENLRHASDPADMAQRASALRMGLERARRLTEQLLEYSRGEFAQSELTLLDLADAARDVIAEFLEASAARRIDLGLDLQASPRVRATPEALRMILRNAVDNAIKYAPAGGTVTVRVARDAAQAVIEVIDDGPGIPAELLHSALAPFSRLGHDGPGSGLGLAIAHDAARRLGGQISLHLRRDMPGLVFRYRQPRARD